jgi:hypothetical protein
VAAHSTKRKKRKNCGRRPDAKRVVYVKISQLASLGGQDDVNLIDQYTGLLERLG